jgi:hypothetical protein
VGAAVHEPVIVGTRDEEAAALERVPSELLTAAPFGGVKPCGLGREGVDEYLEIRYSSFAL